ncbi:MAG TPA: uracil-DNA glycosylase [Gemmataceae bacterium]|jgi:DNA polymerase|nr:uracil-DNA glycosylase [Gemmataceae bacterium]
MSADDIDLKRQVVETLRSLQAGGVDWLPKLPVLEVAAVAQAPIVAEEQNMKRPVKTPEPTPVTAPSLLDVTATMTIEERRTALEVLRERVAGCTRCEALATTRKQTVFDDGKIGAELCFIGEAPGADEDAQGKPFVGAAGQLLNKIIAACGMKREEVYICNIIKCRPPGNRTPLPNEADNCKEYLDEQLALVRPKYIVCLGSTAATYLLGVKKPLGQLRGRFHDSRGAKVVVTYHPAYLLPHRNPAAKKDVWDDMKMLLTHMGRPIPATKSGDA